MKRKYQRVLAQASARGHRMKTRIAQLFNTSIEAKIDDEAERQAADVAEAEALADSASTLRGGVAKVAQLRAYFEGHGPGGFGPEARRILARLWDQLPSEKPHAIRQVLTEELKAEPELIFSHFELEPMAAASLGQVHAAKLEDGKHVAIKVQYPEVAAALQDDLSAPGVLEKLVGADLGEALSTESLTALRGRLLAELDYRLEAESLRRFRRAFCADPCIVVPAVVDKHTTKRVLTMERLFGRSLPMLSLHGSDDERTAAAKILFRFAFLSPWRHRIINLDPNPGNYLILEGDAQCTGPVRVGFLDFGCTAELTEDIIDADQKLFLAMIHRDGEELRYAAHRAGLIEQAASFHSSTYRSWEETLAAPFLSREPSRLDPTWARELTDLTWRLVKTGKLMLPPSALLLWRQRLGVFSVLASLRPVLPMRRLLAELLDSGENPISLYERYR